MCVCSQLPVRLEVQLIDTEAARQRLEQLSLTHGHMSAVNRTLRSNRSVAHVILIIFTKLSQLRTIPTCNHSSLFLILVFNLRDLYFLGVFKNIKK